MTSKDKFEQKDDFPMKKIFNLSVTVVLVLSIVLYSNPGVITILDNDVVDDGSDVSDVDQVIILRPKISFSPINITQNSDFLTCYCTSKGDGSESDPFIIENLIIEAAGSSGIVISNTTSYFEIRDVDINGSKPLSTSAIKLTNVSHGTISSSQLTNGSYGIRLTNSSFIQITQNLFKLKSPIGSNLNTGIYVDNSSFINIKQNNFVLNFNWGIYVTNYCYNITVVQNTFDNNNSGGIFAELTNNSLFENNYLTLGNDGLFIRGFNNKIINNTLYEQKEPIF